MRHIKEVEYN